MKIFQKILSYSFILCIFAQSTFARHKKEDYSQKLYDALIAQEPLKIDYKKIINPTEIELGNPDALKEEPVRLTHEQKIAKYASDKELRNIFHRHAYGLISDKIFNSKQALNFFNMNIHEQQEQMLKWLKDHNVHQNNQLKEASNKYRDEIKTFKGTIQYDTVKAVVKLQKAIANRDDEIKQIKKRLEKTNITTTERQQKHQEISRLEQQNNVDDQSIQTQLNIVLEKLDDIDHAFKMRCEEIIQDYQAKNYEILGTVNNIVSSQKQSFSLKTSDKHTSQIESRDSKLFNNPEIGVMPKNPHSVILSESKETLSNNPILNTIIERHEKELLNMKRNNPEYKIVKEELAYLKSARNLRDIRGTAIN